MQQSTISIFYFKYAKLFIESSVDLLKTMQKLKYFIETKLTYVDYMQL